MEDKKINSALGDIPTGINYHEDTDSSGNEGENVLTRISDLEMTSPIDTGTMFQVTPNHSDDELTKLHKEENIKGVLKLDNNNPIWNESDEMIGKALLNKLQERYLFVEMKGLKITIDRNKNIIQYEYKDNGIRSFRVKAEGEEDEKEAFFEDLIIGETFYIDPQKFQAKYPGFYKNPQFKNIKFNRETKWKKTSPATFCLYLEGGKCIEAYVSFAEAAIGSKFKVYSIDSNYAVYLGYLKQALGREIMKGDEFTKISENSFKDAISNKILKINQPLSLQIYFTVFTIEVDDEVNAVGSVPLKDVPVGSIFVFTTSSVKKIYRERGGVVPGKTKFIRMSQSEFYLWKPNKVDEDIFVEYNTEMKEMGFVPEDLRKKMEKSQKQAYKIVDNMEPRENNFGSRQISAGSYVIIISEQDFSTKKKSNLDALLESLFGKYAVTKDDKGEFIIISPKDLEAELSSAELNTTDFDKLTHDDDTQIPTGKMIDKDGKQVPEMETKKTKMGNTEHYFWFLNSDGNWVVNK